MLYSKKWSFDFHVFCRAPLKASRHARILVTFQTFEASLLQKIHIDWSLIQPLGKRIPRCLWCGLETVRSMKKYIYSMLTFITSASRSSIFVESGSSRWRLTSSRSVLAASSGCFTSTDMVQTLWSTAQFPEIYQIRGRNKQGKNRIYDQKQWETP